MAECRVPAQFTITPERNASDILFDIPAIDPEQHVFWAPTADDGWRPMTATESVGAVRALAKGLIAAGVQAGDRVALLSATRLEWTMFDFAIWAAGAIPVPIYDTSSADQLDWILQDSGATAIVVETPEHRALLDSVGPSPELVFQIDDPQGPGAVESLSRLGTDVPDEILDARRRAVTADSPGTLIYTSGTTGRSKGVLLKHCNLLSEVEGLLNTSINTLIGPDKTFLLFLPMAHVLTRSVNLAALQAGISIGYTNHNTDLLAHFAEFKPNGILAVPRVFEKVYTGARGKAYADGPRKGKTFDAAVLTALEYSEALEEGGPGFMLRNRHRTYDKLVYGKLRAALGGRCEGIISGGAALNSRLAHFFRGAGIPVYEGYGLTETTAAICVNTPAEMRLGTVGRPLPGNIVRIAGDGEVLLSGQVLFNGYWHNDAETASAVRDGWFHTGDLGALDADGYLKITGRKKELLITASGKNVAPGPLEDMIRAASLVSDVMVVGEQRPFVSALITIDPTAFESWKERHRKPSAATIEELADDPALIAEVQTAVDYANRSVSRAESIRRYRILTSDFTVSTGELTPTLKLRRDVVAEKFADDIAAIYGA
ncbi:MAG: long-chain fatty acid--CoA ligase [Gordonia sp. (in: high G+C Gram-positive bacteria)]